MPGIVKTAGRWFLSAVGTCRSNIQMESSRNIWQPVDVEACSMLAIWGVSEWKVVIQLHFCSEC